MMAPSVGVCASAPSSFFAFAGDTAIARRNVEVLREYAAREPAGKPRSLRLRFCTSPVAILGDGRVEAVEVVRNRLVADGRGQIRAVPTEEREVIPCGIVLRSVGYRGVAVPGVPFDEERRTSLRRISVKVFERDRSWTIVGDEGDLFQQTSNVEIRQNVVLTSSDGFRLETSVLRWEGAERRLWTDAPVRMSRDGAVIDGAALEVRIGDETTTMTGRVHATFTRKQPAR